MAMPVLPNGIGFSQADGHGHGGVVWQNVLTFSLLSQLNGHGHSHGGLVRPIYLTFHKSMGKVMVIVFV